MLKNLLKKRFGNEKGMTLIELLAVIVILAIVAAIAVPAIGNIINNSEIKAAKADVANVLSAANLYFTENSSDSSASEADLADYVESWGVLESVTVTVTKGNPNTLSIGTNETISAGGKTIKISGATIDGLNVNSADEVGTQFDFQ